MADENDDMNTAAPMADEEEKKEGEADSDSEDTGM